MKYIIEPEKKIPVCVQADICVIGGGCTGVFAAVRAARLGARVVLVEKHNCLGGVATAGLVNVWHGLHDVSGRNQIIAGLTWEMIERFKSEDALIYGNTNTAYTFNAEQLKFELDNLIKEHKIKLFLHTYYTAAIFKDGKVESIIIENKNGRSAINADFFIDASGDGDMARDLGLTPYRHSHLQPPTACFLMHGSLNGVNTDEILTEYGGADGLADDWGWKARIPGLDDITMRADNHVFGVDCSNAEELTGAEIEGRRKANAFVKLLNKHGKTDSSYKIISSCANIGIRESVHYKTLYKATESDLLNGKKFDDAILNGTYRVDIHHAGNAGITFRYLDGTETIIYGRNTKKANGRWRNDNQPTPEYYQIPFGILINETISNFIPVGRMINADEGSFGALRVMVNLNQLGEAAGVGAYLALNSNNRLCDVDVNNIRKELKKGGSAIL